MATGGAVMSAGEFWVHRIRPVSASSATSPRPATYTRSPSRVGAGGPSPTTGVWVVQRTSPFRTRRLVTVPSSA